MSGVTLWLVSERLQTVKVSAVVGDCGVARSVVTTRAASYWTPISRMAVHFSVASERVTQGNDAGIVGGVEVDPGEGIGGLLGADGCGEEQRYCDAE